MSNPAETATLLGPSTDQAQPIPVDAVVVSGDVAEKASSPDTPVCVGSLSEHDTSATLTAVQVADSGATAVEPPDEINAPALPPWRILLLFLGFGARAFGGPVAQINIMKDELVVQGKWISMKRFVRAYAAYQVLPGPEATELACYFGMLAGGPLGGLLGGLGFIAPGVLLMLLFSWFYVTCASVPVFSLRASLPRRLCPSQTASETASLPPSSTACSQPSVQWW